MKYKFCKITTDTGKTILLENVTEVQLKGFDCLTGREVNREGDTNTKVHLIEKLAIRRIIPMRMDCKYGELVVD